MTIAFASVPPMIAIQPKTRKILGFNQQSYQALKSSMALNLRRQLLIAVCDNVEMQNQLATQLERDLAKGGPTSLDAAQLASLGERLPIAQDFSGQLPRAISPVVGLERLIFDPEDGNLPKQVANWVRQTLLEEGELPMVQVLGIEKMTRQPAITQNHFLRSLEKVEALLPRLNTSLLVWLPWPWLRTIQQSATTFWNWRTGLFEFVSDPTPAALNLESSPLNFAAVESGTPLELQTPNPQAHTEDSDDHYLGALGQADLQRSVTSAAADWPSEFDEASQQASGLYGEGTAKAQRLEDESSPAVDPETLMSSVAADLTEVDLAVADVSELADNAQRPTILSEQVHDGANYEIVYDAADLDPQVEAVDAHQPEIDIATGQLSLSEELTEQNLAAMTLTPADELSPERADETTHFASPGEQAVKTTAATQRRVKRRKRISLGSMGGLRTVVSKGVNAANSQPSSDEPANLAMRSAQQAEGSLQEELQENLQEELSETFNQTHHQRSALQDAALQDAVLQDATEPLTDDLSDEQKRAAEQKEAQRRLDRQKAADDYFTVGMVYRTRIENGERGLDLIEPAIAAYEGGLRCLTGPHPDWGSGLNDLGTLYWLKAQQIDDQQQAVDCMTHSIQLYQEALDKLSDPNQPADSQADDIVGQLYSNMGAVYTMLATYEEPVSYLTQAAVTYQKALPLYSIDTEPMEYATLQNSLGSVFWKLAHYDEPTDYLHRAIVAYNAALTGYVPEYQPLDYAAVQNNLGITYWSLAKHEQAMLLLKHAISAYRDALNYRTPEVDPAACAITYNNLALAYWDLSKEGAQGSEIDVAQRTRYQKNAVTAFEAALNTSKIANSLGPADRAAIFHCLGDVHIQMADTAPSLTEVATCLQKSLYSYLKAIEGVPNDSPLYQGRLSAIVANLRAHYDQLGLAGQQAALNRVPPDMLSLVMLSL
ncbi:MAG: tetratricopeptide repeat protein [Cyanobacteria bacterium J06598_3]